MRPAQLFGKACRIIICVAHHALAERRLGDLRDRPADVPDLSDEERRRVLVDLDARRRLYRRQLAIESWLADWRRAIEVR